MNPVTFTFLDLLLTSLSANTCPERLYQCASDNSFYTCVDANLDPNVNYCSPGSFCTDGCGLSCYSDARSCPMFDIYCTKSLKCISDNSYVKCKDGLISGLVTKCNPDEICDENQTTNPCVKVYKPPPFVCPESWKLFPTNDCSYYYLCITAGTIVEPKLCPSGSKFDKIKGECSQTVICPEPPTCKTGSWCFGSKYYHCLSPQDIPKESEAQPCDFGTVCDHSCGKIACKPNNYKEGVCPVPFVCPSQGRFPVPGDCSRYFQCILVGGVLVKEEVFCPGTSKFDSLTSTCTNNNIVCGGTSTNPPVTVTPTPPATTNCLTSGRHLIPGTNCMQYDYCVIIDGIWRQGIYRCPTGSYFNPATSVCTTTPFVCPY